MEIVKKKFKVVKNFEITPKNTPGHYEVWMIASRHKVDDDYTPKEEQNGVDVKSLIGDVDGFISSQKSRLGQKLGTKLGQGRLPFEKIERDLIKQLKL